MRTDTREATRVGRFSNLNNQKYSNIIEFTADDAAEVDLAAVAAAR